MLAIFSRLHHSLGKSVPRPSRTFPNDPMSAGCLGKFILDEMLWAQTRPTWRIFGKISDFHKTCKIVLAICCEIAGGQPIARTIFLVFLSKTVHCGKNYDRSKFGGGGQFFCEIWNFTKKKKSKIRGLSGTSWRACAECWVGRQARGEEVWLVQFSSKTVHRGDNSGRSKFKVSGR